MSLGNGLEFFGLLEEGEDEDVRRDYRKISKNLMRTIVMLEGYQRLIEKNILKKRFEEKGSRERKDLLQEIRKLLKAMESAVKTLCVFQCGWCKICVTNLCTEMAHVFQCCDPMCTNSWCIILDERSTVFEKLNIPTTISSSIFDKCPDDVIYGEECRDFGAVGEKPMINEALF